MSVTSAAVPSRSRRAFAAFAIVAVAGVVVAGLVLIGPPSEARARRLDERRVDDLRRISYAVDDYRRRHDRLPATLDSLASAADGTAGTRDPVTGQSYVYRIVDTTHYELCATFDRPSDADTESPQWPADRIGNHPAGRHCFALESSIK